MKKFLDKLRNVLAIITAVLFAVIFVLIIVEIICRTFLGFSLLWMTDFVQIVVCWMLAFGMSAIIYTRDHLRIDFIKDMLPQKAKRFLSVLTGLLELIFFVMLVPYGAEIAETKMNIMFTTLRWPTGYMYAALPVFAFFCSVFSAWLLYDSVRKLISGGRTGGK